MEKSPIIFAEGLFFRRPRTGAPTFIKGHLDMNVSKLIKFLEAQRANWDDKGWLHVDLKESKDGTSLYFSVNTWKPKKPEEQTADLQPIKDESIKYPEEVNPNDVPF